jgi:hypothetical protein
MKLNYTCSLYDVEFYEAVHENQATQTPSKMFGEFCYEGYEPFHYQVLFCPMGGLFTMIQVNNEWRPLSTQRNEERYKHIAESAMSLACGNRESDIPEEFEWSLTHTEETVYNRT